MDDYEDYVELWAHEVKTPLALLTLVLDNRRGTLPEAVGFKLDYARNRMQAFIDQMLYYARLRGARRDYRFERLTLRGCIDEVLDDYRPLLEEKRLPGRDPADGRDGLCRPARAVLPARAGREQQREVCAQCAGADLFPGKQ